MPAVVLGLLLAAPAAAAHPALLQSAPAAGAVLERPPAQLTLSFSEQVSLRGSALELRRLRGGAAATALPVGALARRGRAGVTARLPAARATAAVYELRWSVLGVDGHVVGGRLRFAVARADGSPPPGIEALGAPAGPAPRVAAAGAEGAATVLARWAGLLAAALLLGGTLLRLRLRRLGDGDERWTRVALLALAVGGASAVAGAIVAAVPAAGGGIDVLVGTANGRIALARLALAVAGALLALRLGLAARAAGERVLGVVGALALAALGSDGHVQALDGGAQLAALALAVVHVLAAGAWAGGVLALAVLALPRRAPAAGGPPHALAAADGARALLPLAGIAVLALAATGIAAALREVDRDVFLWHTSYGRVVVAKSALLLGLGALGAWIALRRRRPRGLVLRADAIGLAGVLLLAAVLAGLVQGRGQPLPAQRGNVLGGPATATAVVGDALVQLSVAPALPGANVVAAVVRPVDGARGAPPRSIAVRLRRAGGATEVVAAVRRTAGGAWAARVDLPSAGTWYAYVEADRAAATAPVALAVGDGKRFGPPPREVIQTADLSGAAAGRCRAHAQGLALAIGYANARGGVDGGDKLALRSEDDGGSPARAAELVRAARARGAIALVGPCGGGGAGALAAAGPLPAIVADPDVAAPRRARSWRLAPDARAEGVAIGQYVVEQGTEQRPLAPRRIAVLPATDAAGRRRLAGLRAAAARGGLRIELLAPDVLGRPAAFARAIDAEARLAVVLDGVDAPALAAAVRRVGRRMPRVSPASIVVRAGLLDERLQEDAGPFGRLGVIQAASELAIASRDAIAYKTAAAALHRGDRPSVAGLRGFLAGRALEEGLRDGVAADRIAARLRRPRRFTDALHVPWRSDAPSAGAPLVGFLVPRFLPARLVPVAAGGERFSGTWFADGSWQSSGTHLYGPPLPGLAP